MNIYIDDCIFPPLLATRRCTTNGTWDLPYCIGSEEFRNILNMVCKAPNLYFKY